MKSFNFAQATEKKKKWSEAEESWAKKKSTHLNEFTKATQIGPKMTSKELLIKQIFLITKSTNGTGTEKLKKKGSKLNENLKDNKTVQTY